MKYDSGSRLAQVCCGVSAIAVPVLLDASPAQATPLTPLEEPPPAAPVPAAPAATEEPLPTVAPVAEPAKPSFVKAAPPIYQPTVAEVSQPQPVTSAPSAEPDPSELDPAVSAPITAPAPVSEAMPEPVAEAAASSPTATAESALAPQPAIEDPTVTPTAPEGTAHPDVEYSDVSVQQPAEQLQNNNLQATANELATADPQSTLTDSTTATAAAPASPTPTSISTESLDNPPQTARLAVSAPEPETSAVAPPLAPAEPGSNVGQTTESPSTRQSTEPPRVAESSREGLSVLAAAPELASPPSGSAADLSTGASIRLSRTQQASPRPRYDLEISAAQLATSNGPENAAGLDGLLDRAGLQFEGLRTNTEIARLDLDYASATGATRGQAKTTRYMANAYYDLPLGGPIRPYIGAGIGYTNIAMRPDNPSAERTTETRFAYQLRTGLRYDVAPQITLNLGYRYFAIPGQVQLGDGQRAISSSAVEIGLQARF